MVNHFVLRVAVVLSAWGIVGCAASLPKPAPAPDRSALERDVVRELDDFHAAAAAADEARYMAHFSDNGVFLGTDATERWTRAAFQTFVHEHFSKGKGWSYAPTRRAIEVSSDGASAWFDEDLKNDRYGPTRGTGVLVRQNGHYLIAQYNLTFTVPNDRYEAAKKAIDAPPPPPPLRDRYKLAYSKATEAAASGDFERARKLLDALVLETKTHPDSDLEFWLYNEMTWLDWAMGNYGYSLGDVDEAGAAITHSTLSVEQKIKLRLHEAWDRAYLFAEVAYTRFPETPEFRPMRIREANEARAKYDSLALSAGDHDGKAVLDAYFFLRAGNGKAAAAAAKRVDIAKDDDLQDLYVIALALDANHEAEASRAVVSRICNGNSYLMKPIIVHEMINRKWECPTK